MTSIAIVGGAGKIARQLHPLLLHDRHEPVALVRRTEQAESLEHTGVRPRLLDLETADVSDMVKALRGVGAVVFSAGGGPDGNIERKRTVDLGGALLTIRAAHEAGIRRIVLVSAIGVDGPLPEDTEPVWRAYVEAKRDADAALRDSGLAWTILRPGRLTDDAPTGRVTLAPELERGEIPRADVAATIATVLDDGRSIHRQWDLLSGDTPIGEAVTVATTRSPGR